jgi:hypothetical protein
MISSVWFETVHSLLLPQPGPKACENTDAFEAQGLSAIHIYLQGNEPFIR